MAGRASDRIAEEQAALRRVATLVARAAPAEEVFAAVTAEVGRLLAVDITALMRSDPQDMITVVGAWTSTGAAAPGPVGSRFGLGGRNVSTLVLRTGRPARLDSFTDVSGTIGITAAREWGFRSAVGVPISVEGRPWGLILVAYTHAEPLPADTRARSTCRTATASCTSGSRTTGAAAPTSPAAPASSDSPTASRPSAAGSRCTARPAPHHHADGSAPHRPRRPGVTRRRHRPTGRHQQ